MGAAAEPPLRWKLTDDDGGQPELFDPVERVPGTRELAGLEFLHVRAKRVINKVPAASRMPFRFTINPYRGCSHACVYCFARPSHAYLNLNTGTDFDTRIVVKVNAVERVRAELAARSWTGELIALGTNTDPYQPCEGRYRLTRGILQALVDTGNSFSIVTKSPLIERDLDLLVAATDQCGVHVDMSVGCLDHAVWRATEPHTPNPARRLQTVKALTDAGVSCGVLVAPVLPGISDGDDQLDRLVHAAVGAGARSIATVPLHLRPGVREHYLEWLQGSYPQLVADHVRRFRSSYQADDERRGLAARVQELAALHRRQANLPGNLPLTPRWRQREPRSTGDTPVDAQLRLI